MDHSARRMAKKRVAFHVGAHKTGTSLLQKYMRDNRGRLRRNRIYYLSRSETNHYVGWGNALRDQPNQLTERINKALHNPWYRTLVASHENTLGRPLRSKSLHLYPDVPEIAIGLKTALQPFDARILVGIRPQDEFLESYYLQRIHEGRTTRFAEWLDGLDLDALSWRPLIDALVSTFGAGRVEVIDFRTIAHGQNAYIENFLKRVDSRWSARVDYKAVRNPSISAKGLDIALAVNPLLESGEDRKLLRTFLQHHFNNRRSPRPQLLSDDQRAWLRTRYGGEYEELVSLGNAADGTGP
jgi:hypothetical protein